MGIVAKFIDSGNDEQKDRAIEARGWSTAFVDEDGCSRCIAGHMEDWHMNHEVGLSSPGETLPTHYNVNSRGFPAYVSFMYLCDRFGLERIVRLCKMRAARGNQELVEKIRVGIYEELKVEEVRA